MANIIDDLKGMVTSEIVSRAAGMLGESEGGINKTIGALIPTLLGGLLNKSSDTSAFSGIFNMLSDNRNIGFLDNIGGLLGGGNLAQNDPKDVAGNLVGQLFGNKVGGILDLVSNYAGVKKSSTSSLLGLVGPVIMGYLGRKIKNEGLNMTGLTSFFASQKGSIMSALPAGMGSLLGFSDLGKSASNAAGAATSAAASGSNKWLWILLGLAALAAAIYFMRGCNKEEVTDAAKDAMEETTSAVTTAADTAAAAINNAADATKEAASGLGAFFKRKLACGVEMNIPEKGIEANLVTFIEDAAKPVDKTTWFSFDRITFETGKASLDMVKSNEQLKNIAEILKCYPKVRLKVGGYTDNTGDAKANMTLSADRAKTVKATLVGLGVEPTRLEAEGYGDQHPVADNATEEGRAKNRRIDVRVLAK